MSKLKCIMIVGPTAVGKTSLSIELAKIYDGEIISADALQVYKGLDIGTAKVTEEEKEGIPHYLIDCLDLEEDYSVSDFQKEARRLILEIGQREKLPIVVGGTGLYMESLIYDVSHGQASAKNQDFRKKMEEEAKKEGSDAIWQDLASKDPRAAKSIHPNNLRRVIRALEVIEESGRLFSDQQEERREKTAQYDFFIIGLDTNRSRLYERINQRVDLMLERGLLDEAKILYEKRDQSLQPAQAIGYKEFFPYFSGDQSLEEAVEQLKQDSRRYAKRQLTWFRNRTPIDIWLDPLQKPSHLEAAKNEINRFLRN